MLEPSPFFQYLLMNSLIALNPDAQEVFLYLKIRSYQLPFHDTGQTAHGPGGLPQFADVHWMTFDAQRFIKRLGLGITGRHHDFPRPQANEIEG
jgi:hypothetical protein